MEVEREFIRHCGFEIEADDQLELMKGTLTDCNAIIQHICGLKLLEITGYGYLGICTNKSILKVALIEISPPGPHAVLHKITTPNIRLATGNDTYIKYNKEDIPWEHPALMLAEREVNDSIDSDYEYESSQCDEASNDENKTEEDISEEEDEEEEEEF